MSSASRRRVLAVAGAGTAAGVVGVAAGPAVAGTRRSGATQEAVVAYVEAGSIDEVTLMVGEREVVVHDAELVSRILDAAGGR